MRRSVKKKIRLENGFKAHLRSLWVPALLTVMISGGLVFTFAHAGSLTPSALPGSTMQSLQNVYDAIASTTFDSSGISGSSNGSLLQVLKYISNNFFFASSSGVVSLSSGNLNISGGTLQLGAVTRIDNSGQATLATTTVSFLTVSGTSTFTGTMSDQGLAFTSATGTSLSLSASSTIPLLNFTTATGTNGLITNFTGTNLNFTSATGTSVSVSGSSTIANLNSINATTTNGKVSNLNFTSATGTALSLSASSTIPFLNFTTATGTNLNISNLTLGSVNGLLQSANGVVGAAASNQYVSSTAAGTGITVNQTTGAVTITNNGVLSLTNGGNINLSSATGTVTLWLNPTLTTSTITTATTTNLNFTSATGTSVSVSGSSTIALLNFTTATGTNGLITNFTGTNLNFTSATGTSVSVSGSSTIALLNFTTATGTNGLVTNFTGTNLNFTAATGTSMSLSASSTVANLNFINATGTNGLVTNFTGTNLNFTSATGTNLTVSGSSTISNITFTNATGTNGLTVNTINASAAMTIGSLAQNLTLQGSTTSIIATSSNSILFTTGGLERMRIASSGNIGIGTTTAAYGFVIGNGTTQKDLYVPFGALCVDTNNSGCPAPGTASSGQIYASATSIAAIDLAENYPTLDTSLEPGDIVSLDIRHPAYITKADDTNRNNIFGIISTAPGVLLGRKVENSRAVALTGRVPVKVSGENGPINIGDPITLSSIPGIGMKGTSTQIIGFALETWTDSSTGTITAFVRLGEIRNPDTFFDAVTNGLQKLAITVEQGILRVGQIFADIIHARRVVTNEFEITDSATGQVYCVRLTNGDWQKIPGSCDSAVSTQPPAPPPAGSAPTPAPATTSTDASSTDTSIAVSSSTSSSVSSTDTTTVTSP